MHYVLRVQGHLDQSWSERFGGLCIEQQEAGTTLLSGSLPDQAALQGLLLQIVRLGLVLLELSTSEANGAEAAADRRPGSAHDAESSGQCTCDCWMAAQFDTYLAEYQHDLCFSFVRGVSFTGQSKNFPSEKAVSGERQIMIKNYAIQSSHVHTDLGKVHAHHPGAISSMTHKMMSDALLLPPSIPASFSAKGTVAILMKEQNTLVRKGHV